MSKKNMVIFASGRGSNAIALYDAVQKGTINAEVKALVCDIPGAPVIDRAREWGIPVILADRKSFATKEAFETYMLDHIEPYKADIICLAGFMRLLSGNFISHYEHKILNIHPALLPSFRGLHAQRQAVEAGVKVAGCTVHLSFPIWMQALLFCSRRCPSWKTIQKIHWLPESSRRNTRRIYGQHSYSVMIN